MHTHIEDQEINTHAHAHMHARTHARTQPPPQQQQQRQPTDETVTDCLGRDEEITHALTHRQTATYTHLHPKTVPILARVLENKKKKQEMYTSLRPTLTSCECFKITLKLKTDSLWVTSCTFNSQRWPCPLSHAYLSIHDHGYNITSLSKELCGRQRGCLLVKGTHLLKTSYALER